MSRSGRVPVALVLGVLVLGLGLAPPAAAQGGPSARQAPTLERGARGAAVRQLQARLAELGYPLEVDGAFGPRTEAAVRAFQRDQRIQVDGQVGPETRGRLARREPGGLIPALGEEAAGPSSRGRGGGAGVARPLASDSPAVAARKALVWAEAARAAGRHTLVVSFEGLASFSQGYANQLYGYQDRLRAGEDARPPRGPALSSYVGQHLIAPSLGLGGGPDVLLLGEHTETAQASVAEPVVLAWREVHGSALKLVVVGHSFGGLSALRLTKKLRARGVAVQQLLTLDARTLPGLYGLFVTPPGVGAHHNYFQRSLWLPGYPIEGAQDHRLRGVRHTRMPAQREVRERFSAMLSAP